MLTYQLRSFQEQIGVITVFPETPGGAGLNSLMFIVLMAASATGMYFLIRYGLKRIIRYLLLAALYFVVFFLMNWFAQFYSDVDVLRTLLFTYPWYGIVAVLSAVFMLGVFRSRGSAHVATVSLIGAMTGTFLGSSIPPLTAVVLLVLLSAYDLYAVYRGPIGKIAQATELEELTGAVFTYRDLTVGLGDMVFYSMLVSNAMMNFGPLAWFTTSAGVTLGAFLGFKMLEGRETFPGLPFALGLGLAAMFIGIVLTSLARPA